MHQITLISSSPQSQISHIFPFSTIVVKVETYKKDPKYGKRIKYSKKYTAHDEENVAKIGDKVRLVATRPLSKTKRYELKEVIEKAVVL